MFVGGFGWEWRSVEIDGNLSSCEHHGVLVCDVEGVDDVTKFGRKW